MKYLEFCLLCIKTVVGSFMIYVLFEVHQTQERDRVMSEAWHRINNEDAHQIYAILESSAIDGWGAIKFCDETDEAGEVLSRTCTTYPTDYHKEHQ